MSEKIRPHFENEPSSEETEKLNDEVEQYLSEQDNPLVEITDKHIDEVLSRYIEKGPELSPDVRASLRNKIRRILDIKI